MAAESRLGLSSTVIMKVSATISFTTSRRVVRSQSTFAMCYLLPTSSGERGTSLRNWISGTRQPRYVAQHEHRASPYSIQLINLEERTMKKLTMSLGLALAMSILFGTVSAKTINTSNVPSIQDDRSFSHKEAGVQ